MALGGTHWLTSALRSPTAPALFFQDQNSASGHVSESDSPSGVLLFKEKLQTSLLYLKYRHCTPLPWKIKKKGEKEHLVVTDVVGQSLPAAGICYCYLMTNSDFSTCNEEVSGRQQEAFPNQKFLCANKLEQGQNW